MDSPNVANARAFNWLAGGRLSDVLHVGDHELAYRLSDQGHEVVVLTPAAQRRSNTEISYVRGTADQLPFITQSFDLVVCPSLRVSAVQAAGFARVLRRDGAVATVSRTYDDTIPWVRRLLAITGAEAVSAADEETVTSSGLFARTEVTEVADWVELDLASTLQFARSIGGPSFSDAEQQQVRDLFAQSAQQTGTLRLRHRTQYLRAQVDKSQLQDLDEAAPDTTLFDLR